MPDPLVSFVVPVYNPPLDIFEELLDAFMSQTEPRWECVLIDDASPSDAVREVLAARAASDGRFTLVLRAENGGIAAATNDGLDVASAPIVAFADHDDLIDATAVAELVAHFDAHPEHALVYSDERMVHADGAHKFTFPKPDYSPIRHLGQNYFNHITAFRAAVVGDLRVRTSFEPAQDSDFVHRAIERIEAAGYSVGHIPKMLYSWRAIEASSALNVGVKSGMFAASIAASQATIDRLGYELSTSNAMDGDRTTINARLEPAPVLADEIEHFALDDTTEPAALNTAIANCSKRFLALIADDIVEASTTNNWPEIVAADATLPGVVAAGPRLRRENLHVLSVGRSIELGLDDPYWDHELAAGPWDAWILAREVSAVAPQCAVINVDVARRIPPMPEDVGLDVAFTAWCLDAQHHRHSVIVTPRADVVLARRQLLDQLDHKQRLAELASTVRHRGTAPVERFTTADAVSYATYPTVWEVAAHLVQFGGVQLLSIALEDGLAVRSSSANPSWLLDPNAAEAITTAQANGVRVCVVGREQSSTDAVTRTLAELGIETLDMIDTVAALSSNGDTPTTSQMSSQLLNAWRAGGDIEPAQVLHLGVDVNGDFQAAFDAGATVLLLDVSPLFEVAPRPGAHLAAWLATGGDDGGLLRAMRSTLLGAGELAQSPGYLFGVIVLGPLVIGGYVDTIDHRTLRSLLATVAAQPGDPVTDATSPFDPGGVRSGNQEAARRAIRELAVQLDAATPAWSDTGFRSALVADAIDAVERPNETLGALLTIWSQGAYSPSSDAGGEAPVDTGEAVDVEIDEATGPSGALLSTRHRVRALLVRRRRTSP